MIGTVKQTLPKTNIDIVREKRYGKKGFNAVVKESGKEVAERIM